MSFTRADVLDMEIHEALYYMELLGDRRRTELSSIREWLKRGGGRG
jgi:hypothetical protein